MNQLLNLIDTIRGETVPFPNHPDPKAINDCWELLIDYVRTLQDSLEMKTELIEYLQNRLKTTELALDNSYAHKYKPII